MTDQNQTDNGADDSIETTLAFDVNHYADHEPLERVAEAVIESGNRRVDYLYDIVHGGDRAGDEDEDELQVHARYYLDGELRNESNRQQTYLVRDGVVYDTYGTEYREVRKFIEANAFADPEVSLTDEFESMVEVSE